MAERLKNYYGKPFIDILAATMQKVYGSFDVLLFTQLIFDEHWPSKTLKERMRHISTTLHTVLPGNYPEKITILRQAAPLMHDVSKHSGLLTMFFPDFVELYGQDDWDQSIVALEEFTQYSSSEFAVRPFIEKNQHRMMQQMYQWAHHPHYHVRRLASEGCRPRLPWAKALPALKKDPSAIFSILEVLKDDTHLYVRRSVANNLNDISKDHPDKVMAIAAAWQNATTHRTRLVKHACRTMLKAANPQALALFGFTSAEHVTIHHLSLNQTVLPIGGTILFQCDIEVFTAGTLRLEYAIDFVKSRGTISRKVFQIKEGTYQTGVFSVQKSHGFRQMTTRKHYPGKHRLYIIINGRVMSDIAFFLKYPSM